MHGSPKRAADDLPADIAQGDQHGGCCAYALKAQFQLRLHDILRGSLKGWRIRYKRVDGGVFDTNKACMPRRASAFVDHPPN